MAFPTALNSQITDSVTQVNTSVVGDAPAVAVGNLFVATSQALSNAAHNATNNQNQSYTTMQTSTTQGVSTLYSIDTATTGVANISGGATEVTLNMTGTMGGDANAQLPTVGNLVAAIPDAVAGASYKLFVINSSSANHVWTITTNTGWTLNGTMTIAQNTVAPITTWSYTGRPAAHGSGRGMFALALWLNYQPKMQQRSSFSNC